jgi:hypothetical protein
MSALALKAVEPREFPDVPDFFQELAREEALRVQKALPKHKPFDLAALATMAAPLREALRKTQGELGPQIANVRQQKAEEKEVPKLTVEKVEALIREREAICEAMLEFSPPDIDAALGLLDSVEDWEVLAGVDPRYAEEIWRIGVLNERVGREKTRSELTRLLFQTAITPGDRNRRRRAAEGIVWVHSHSGSAKPVKKHLFDDAMKVAETTREVEERVIVCIAMGNVADSI